MPVRYFFPSLLIAACLVSCGEHTVVKSPAFAGAMVTIASPLPQADIKSDTFRISCSAGGVINYFTGTKVTFPADAFVYPDGTPVKGDVNVLYREFHSPSEIIVSGIPMCYDNNGTVEYFESAGMFQMSGTCEGKEVKIAAGKSAEVQMATHRSEDDFNFYRIDPGTVKWQELAKNSKAVVNENRKNELAQIQKSSELEKPVEPVKASNAKKVFDLDINFTMHPELKELGSCVWQYCGDDESKNPLNNQWVFSKDVRSVNLHDQGNGKFLVTFNGGNKILTSEVQPALSDAAYERMMVAYNRDKANHEAKLKAARAIAEGKSELTRTFQINNFGTFNCDRFNRELDPQTAKPEIVFDVDKTLPDGTPFYMLSDKKSVITYYSGYEIKYSMKEDNSLLAVLPDGRIGVVRTDSFNEAHSGVKRKKMRFNLEVAGNVANKGDLDKIIAQL